METHRGVRINKSVSKWYKYIRECIYLFIYMFIYLLCYVMYYLLCCIFIYYVIYLLLYLFCYYVIYVFILFLFFNVFSYLVFIVLRLISISQHFLTTQQWNMETLCSSLCWSLCSGCWYQTVSPSAALGPEPEPRALWGAGSVVVLSSCLTFTFFFFSSGKPAVCCCSSPSSRLTQQVTEVSHSLSHLISSCFDPDTTSLLFCVET